MLQAMNRFDDFFHAATGHAAPHDYQRRLGCGEPQPGELREHWLAHGTACRSQLIHIPTGLGKTAGIVRASSKIPLRMPAAWASALVRVEQPAQGSGRQLADLRRPLAATPAGGESPPPLGEHPGARGAEHGVRGRASESANPPRDARPDRATRFVQTTRDALNCHRPISLLAEARPSPARRATPARPLDSKQKLGPPLSCYATLCAKIVTN